MSSVDSEKKNKTSRSLGVVKRHLAVKLFDLRPSMVDEKFDVPISSRNFLVTCRLYIRAHRKISLCLHNRLWNTVDVVLDKVMAEVPKARSLATFTVCDAACSGSVVN